MGSHVSRAWRSLSNQRPNMNADEQSDDNDSLDSNSAYEDFALARVLQLMIHGGQHPFVGHSYDKTSSSESEEEKQCCPSAKRRKADVGIKADHEIDQEVALCNGEILHGSSESQGTNKVIKNIASIVKKREINCCGYNRRNPFTNGICTSLSSRYIPNDVEHRLSFDAKLFCGTYSEDGNTFLSACQDRHIRVYKTRDLMSTPLKDIQAHDVGWSILDTAFSHDSRYAIYSSWSNFVHLCSVYDGGDPKLTVHRALDLNPGQHTFAVFSLRFSSGGDEIICGSNDGDLYIYDMNRDKRTLRINAHEDDANAVCFADSSSQIIYSGGDDGLVKVWDRRIFSDEDARPAGCLAGHQDGITYIDSKGDTRYLISNSKDQSIKLWDVRRFSSHDAVENVKRSVSRQVWDYRWQGVPRQFQSRMRKRTLPGDTSVRTYTGHRVLNTLIRARFSPMHSTGNKYIYAGCSTGKVIIYDLLSGEIVSNLRKHRQCVRDVSWHPYDHRLVSSSWDGSMAVWSWKSGKSPVDI